MMIDRRKKTVAMIAVSRCKRFIEAFSLVEEHLGSATDGSQTFSLAFLEQNHPDESNGYDKLQNVQQRVQGAIAPPFRVKRTPLLYHSCRALTMKIRLN